jgi:hypothetical protein
MRGVCLVPTLLLILSLGPARLAGAAETPLKLLVSIEQSNITEPFPARITLHLHNGGKTAVWLYRRARGKIPVLHLSDEDTTPVTSGGSILAVKVEPAGGDKAAAAKPAEATLLESANIPKTKLVKVAAGEDYEENASLHLEPALSELQSQIWGAYRLTITYKAEYSNAEEVQRAAKVALWQGEVSSNPIDVQLQAPQAQGEIAGTVDTPRNVPIRDAIVSLTDKQERLIGQMASDPEGRYSFSNLPPGFYWVTARRPSVWQKTSVFRHVELTASKPSATQQLVLVQEEAWLSKQVVHKPVLFRVNDAAGRPLAGVGIRAVYSDGEVVDDVKAETDEDGDAALEVIPGRNFVTLKRRGCPNQDERADVAEGWGVAAFAFTFQCAKK